MALKPVHNETELIEQVVKGNEKAFSDLFYAYHNQLGEYVMLLTQSLDMTEEIVQDVFVKVWLNREGLSHIGKFTSYLFILTRNYTLNCIRKSVNERKGQQQYAALTLLDDNNLITEIDQEPDKDYQALIDRAIANLPPQQQKVFVLRQEGLKNPEIAKKMEISPESVKKYQQWALKSVSEFVKAHAALSAILISTSVLR